LLLAVERAGGGDLQARIEGTLAYVEAELGDPVEAMALCERALRRRGTDPVTRGVLTSQRGLLFMRRGDTQAALRDFAYAVPLVEDDDELVGRLLLNRGGVHLQRGDIGPAREDFERARGHLSRAGLPFLDAKAAHNLGYALFLSGELVSALRVMEEAATVLAPLSEVSRAVGDQDRAEVLIAAGLVSEGEKTLADVATAYGLRGLRQYQAEAELVRARTLLQVAPGPARTVARQAARRFRSRDAQAWALRASAVALMAAVAGGGRGRSLIEEADALLPRLAKARLHVELPQIQLHAARVLVRRGELAEAGARLRRIRLGDGAPIVTRLMTHEVRADLARARRRTSESLRHIRAGLTELHAWQASFGSLDLQSGVVGHGRQLALDGLRMAVADGGPELLFEWSERARTLVSRVVPVRPPSDEAVGAELAELRWLQAQQPDPRSKEGRRMAELQATIRQHAWYGGGSGQVTEPCSLSELRDGLGERSALVAYVAAAGRVVALVVTDAATTARDLGPLEPLETLLGGLHPDLDMAGSDLPAAFAAPVRRELTGRLERLAGLLVEPIAEDLGDRRAVLTPSGLLAGVPWGLLPGWHGRAVTVTQSATSWLARQATPLRVASAGFIAGPRVGRAEAEVVAAAETWDRPAILTGGAATAQAVSDLAARVDVLHLSAHGRHSAENPLFSGVELVDGPWFGYDIDQLAEVPDVVLLSACEVGRSQVRYGEELIGMTTAWLHAGARSVIASAAAVNDETAHDVLVAVHRGLGRGLDPAAALAAALPDRGEADPPAPFVCFC
jgi:tetratricopeptide (TPR) repeat protein